MKSPIFTIFTVIAGIIALTIVTVTFAMLATVCYFLLQIPFTAPKYPVDGKDTIVTVPIESLILHETDSYSAILPLDPNYHFEIVRLRTLAERTLPVLKTSHGRFYALTPRLYADVPATSSPFITFKWIYNPSALTIIAEIHLHSHRDIEMGNWSHGKAGSGTNTYIER